MKDIRPLVLLALILGPPLIVSILPRHPISTVIIVLTNLVWMGFIVIFLVMFRKTEVWTRTTRKLIVRSLVFLLILFFSLFTVVDIALVYVFMGLVKLDSGPVHSEFARYVLPITAAFFLAIYRLSYQFRAGTSRIVKVVAGFFMPRDGSFAVDLLEAGERIAGDVPFAAVLLILYLNLAITSGLTPLYSLVSESAGWISESLAYGVVACLAFTALELVIRKLSWSKDQSAEATIEKAREASTSAGP